MKFKRNVFLVGPMGVGKTTIGRIVAEQLALDFFDSDLQIEATTGADIPWIFDVEGESGFRERERKMIDHLSSKTNIVLATGGGAVLAHPEERGIDGQVAVSLPRQEHRHRISAQGHHDSEGVPNCAERRGGLDILELPGLCHHSLVR